MNKATENELAAQNQPNISDQSTPAPQKWFQKWPERLLLEKREMNLRFPQFELYLTEGYLSWAGKLETNRGNSYLIEIKYQDDFPNNPPLVYLLDPPIKAYLDEDNNHGYKHQYPDGHLCLFYPNDYAFSPLTTAVAVVAATATWLFAYESWMESDRTEWPGLETHDNQPGSETALNNQANLSATEQKQTIRQKLEEAIFREKDILVEYHSLGKPPQQHKIEPLQIYEQAGLDYLIAYDFSRKDQRHFRLDRIRFVDSSQDFESTEAMFSGKEDNNSKGKISKTIRPAVIALKLTKDPLTLSNFTGVLSAITRLYTKSWLISQNRFNDLIEYSQNYNPRFEAEAGFYLGKLSHNSPANFEGRFDASPQGLVEAIEAGIDGIILAPSRVKERQLKNKALELEVELKKLAAQDAHATLTQNLFIEAQKAFQQIQEAYQKTDLENQQAKLKLELEMRKAELEMDKAKFELEKEREQFEFQKEKQRFELERERLALQRELLEFEAKRGEYAFETAQIMVNKLQPKLDSILKGMLAQSLVPELLFLSEEKGLERQNQPKQPKEENKQSNDAPLEST